MPSKLLSWVWDNKQWLNLNWCMQSPDIFELLLVRIKGSRYEGKITKVSVKCKKFILFKNQTIQCDLDNLILTCPHVVFSGLFIC